VSHIPFACSSLRLSAYANLFQPDGYLTEERKAADPDHGFSTFFSETGTFDYPLWLHESCLQADHIAMD
jgi:hypothetical protein